MSQIKLLHIITGLNTGGAEMMLLKLLSALDRDRFDCVVVSLSGRGRLAERIEQLGVPVEVLELTPMVPSPKKLHRLARLLRREQPQVVQTWMYHSDLLGSLIARCAGNFPIVWNLQSGTLDSSNVKTSTRLVMRTCSWLSRHIPERIVCCSKAVRNIHAQVGYSSKPMTVIPNAVDPSVFFPNVEARESVRREMGLRTEDLLIGVMARFDPQKDHLTFLRAASLVANRFPESHFVLCGSGMEGSNERLRALLQRTGMEGRCHLLGLRNDIPRLTASLDIAALSSSYGEGLANSILEAMSCGVPCVVTDVGGNGELVGDTGRVVQVGAPEAFAAALCEVITIGPQGRERLGNAARDRIERAFSLPVIAHRYEEMYEQIVADEFSRRTRLATGTA